eukprot:3938098-Rhodomonas_salina.1
MDTTLTSVMAVALLWLDDLYIDTFDVAPVLLVSPRINDFSQNRENRLFWLISEDTPSVVPTRSKSNTRVPPPLVQL